MSVDLTELLRLEIERPPDAGELVNLVQNPSGDLGAWGWVTPVTGSTLRSYHDAIYGNELVYTSPGGVASYFYTEHMPVTPGQYVAAHWRAPLTLSSKYAAKVEWLGIDDTVLGSTTATSHLSASTDPVAYGSFLVPAGTAYCRLRFDHFATGGGNPPALSAIGVQNVTLTAAATAGDLGWQHVNLLPTPNGEHGTGSWGSGAGTIGTSSAQEWGGRTSLILTKTGGDGAAAAVSEAMAVQGGRDYTFQVRSRARTTLRTVTVAARWFKADGSEIATTKIKSQVETAGAFTVPISGVATAPTNAATVRMRVEYGRMTDGELHYFTAGMVEQASRVGTQFDGDTPDAFGTTFVWSGTPGASTSVATGLTGDVGTLVPVAYQNILGPTAQISVDREGLNVGSLTARLFDAVLDPTQTDLIQPGKRFRLVTTDGDVIFAGKTLTAKVTYHLLEHDEHKRAEVSLTAVDPINALAAAKRREGVATVDELPYVLEGAGVPWSCNGSGNQVPTATVVSYNDNASALDQVAVTRDSVLGYAWVDRNGVAQVWDRADLDATVAAVLDATTYNADLDIDFDLDRVINSVSVIVLRVIATSGVTEEVTFGPYVDTDSYRTYGEHHQDFTVQGFDADDTAAIADYAQQILDANATPRMRVNQLVLPIRSAEDLPKALLDLYDLVNVVNERAGVDEDSRVETIQHEITPGKWLTTIGFAADGSVAPSTAVPSPPPGVGTIKAETDAAVSDAMAQATTALSDAADAFDEAAAATMQIAGWTYTGTTEIDGGNIRTDTIGAGQIAADAISAKHTLTGPIIQTDASTGSTKTGIKMNSAAFIAYHPTTHDPVFSISLATGAVAMLGSLTSGSQITGANIYASYFENAHVIVSNDDVQAFTGLGLTGPYAMLSGSAKNLGVGGFKPGLLVYDGVGFLRLYGAAGDWNMDGDLNIAGSLSVSGSFPSAWNGNATYGLDMNANPIFDVSSVAVNGGVTAGGAGHFSTVFADSVPTTGAAINAVMGGSGQFLMNTSARRYKYDEQPFEIDLAAVRALLHKRFRRYDDPAYDPEHPEAGRWYHGVIANEAEALGLTPWCTYDVEGELQSFDYPGFATAVALATARDYDERLVAQDALIANLTARLEQLEA